MRVGVIRRDCLVLVIVIYRRLNLFVLIGIGFDKNENIESIKF